MIQYTCSWIIIIINTRREYFGCRVLPCDVHCNILRNHCYHQCSTYGLLTYYSRTSNEGPSEKGTLYVRPLYKGHCLESQNNSFHTSRTSEKRTISPQGINLGGAYLPRGVWPFFFFQCLICHIKSSYIVLIVIYFMLTCMHTLQWWVQGWCLGTTPRLQGWS